MSLNPRNKCLYFWVLNLTSLCFLSLSICKNYRSIARLQWYNSWGHLGMTELMSAYLTLNNIEIAIWFISLCMYTWLWPLRHLHAHGPVMTCSIRCWIWLLCRLFSIHPSLFRQTMSLPNGCVCLNLEEKRVSEGWINDYCHMNNRVSLACPRF